MNVIKENNLFSNHNLNAIWIHPYSFPDVSKKL